MKNAHLINALIKKLEGEIAVAEAKDKLEVCKLILHPFENVKQ